LTAVTGAAAVSSSTSSPSVSLGLLENASLFLYSILLVKLVYWLLRVLVMRSTSKQNQIDNNNDPQQSSSSSQPTTTTTTAGILNRCPWPFIFFHDIPQGLKDSPTWMVVTFVALRIVYKQYRR
jgi:hypothetical protein